MKQKWKSFGICCLIICVLLVQCTILSPISVLAAGGATISFSSNTVRVGDTVTATITFSGGENAAMGSIEAELTYDKDLLTFVSGANAYEYASGSVSMVASTTSTSGVPAFTFQLTFQAKKAGSAVLKAATIEFCSIDNTIVDNVSINKSLTVRKISTNANLKTLTVNSGTLSPAFAAGTTSYKVSVANSVSSITVSATAADSNATVSGTGKKSLTAGKTTTITVKVTAEDGSTTKTYTIAVTRAAATPIPTKTPSPTKGPTPTPTKTATATRTPTATKTPTATQNSTTPPITQHPTDTPTGTTQGPGVINTEIPTGTEPMQSTQTPSMGTETVATPTPGSTGQSTCSTPTMTSPNNGTDYSGFFTVQAAFIFCAVGMFLVGGAVGFILCYVLQSKKGNND